MSEAAPQLPPAEQGPAPEYSVYHQLQIEREQAARDAELAAQAQQENARNEQIATEQARAENVGLPYMHPDKRSSLEATAAANSVDELPESVDPADRHRATRGFHTSHLDAEQALTEIKQNASQELTDFDEQRTHAEHMALQGERHRAGREARQKTAELLESTFESRLAEAMGKHQNLGEGAKAMLESNLREQMKAEDAKSLENAGAKAGEARINYINGRGGVDALNEIREEEATAKRLNEEGKALQAKRAKRAEERAETEAWQDRMGVNQGRRQAAPDSVRMPESEELVRPDSVAGKDWLAMNAAQKRKAMAEAAREASDADKLAHIREMRGQANDGAESGKPKTSEVTDQDVEDQFGNEILDRINGMTDEEFADFDAGTNFTAEELAELPEATRNKILERRQQSGLMATSAEASTGAASPENSADELDPDLEAEFNDAYDFVSRHPDMPNAEVDRYLEGRFSDPDVRKQYGAYAMKKWYEGLLDDDENLTSDNAQAAPTTGPEAASTPAVDPNLANHTRRYEPGTAPDAPGIPDKPKFMPTNWLPDAPFPGSYNGEGTPATGETEPEDPRSRTRRALGAVATGLSNAREAVTDWAYVRTPLNQTNQPLHRPLSATRGLGKLFRRGGQGAANLVSNRVRGNNELDPEDAEEQNLNPDGTPRVNA